MKVNGVEIAERHQKEYYGLKNEPIMNDPGWYARKSAGLIEELSQAEAHLKEYRERVALAEDFLFGNGDTVKCGNNVDHKRRGNICLSCAIEQAESQICELRQDQDTLIDAQKDALGDEVLKAVVERIVGFVPEDIARGIAALKAENAQLICDRVPRQQYEGLSDENVRLKDENKATLDAITQVCSASQINVITGLVIAARTGGRA